VNSSLPDSNGLWAITTFFNPAGYRRRRENYRVFRERLGVDPSRDIAIGDSGAWVWSSDKPEMHAYVRDYFAGRREAG
jgi:hypothetical protein